MELFLPELCIEEAAAWFLRPLPERFQAFEKAALQLHTIKGLSTLGIYGVVDDFEALITTPFHSPEGIANEGNLYRKYLHDRFGEVGTIVPTPPVSHDILVWKAANRRRPFNDSGGGYRDALLWEVVCFLAKEGPLTLLSADRRAFTDDGGRLHEHLLLDLDAMGLAGTVTLQQKAQ